MAEGEITVRELRGASEDSTVQIWRDHSQEHPTLWLPRYSFSSALDLCRGSGFSLSFGGRAAMKLCLALVPCSC